ncbi:3-deoxy-7-phosphoheptulonate synthase [Bradyrhizobium sp.]|uniref:3-deoxy-7-phosphoheptulonate synthase n=1 Tax=Bradyrhizobium sp. TaxID=376 RepID=UPI002DDD1AB6|nr:3-deoxy-7-phosphoheptulonate synthase [Bradyrhizobium sp.]HEV2157862.1 3-deoxy-7-phosphoheptulonate synthase [Bradyrhizobium sp.]
MTETRLDPVARRCARTAGSVTDESLSLRYQTAVDPRLNANQALELALLIAEMARTERIAGKQLRMEGGRSEGRTHEKALNCQNGL